MLSNVSPTVSSLLSPLQEQKLFKDLNSGNPKTRALVELQLLEKVLENQFDKTRAESIVKKILAKNHKSAEAHMVLSKVLLADWWLTKDIDSPSILEDKRKGLEHLRQAKRLYKEKNMRSQAQKLEKVESEIQRGEGYLVWFDSFPELGKSINE